MNSDGFCQNHRSKVAAKEADESAKTAVAAEKAAKRRRIEEKETEKAATLEYDTIFSGFGITMQFLKSQMISFFLLVIQHVMHLAFAPCFA